MILLRVLGVLASLVFIYVIVFQVLLPLWRGQPIFPALRRAPEKGTDENNSTPDDPPEK